MSAWSCVNTGHSGRFVPSRRSGAGNVVHRAVGQVARDAELAVVAAVVGEAGEIAADLELHALEITIGERRAQVGRAWSADTERGRKRASCEAQARCSSPFRSSTPGKALAGAGRRVRGAGTVFARPRARVPASSARSPAASSFSKCTSRSATAMSWRAVPPPSNSVDRPTRARGEAIEGDHRCVEHAGQLDRAAVEAEACAAALLVRVEGHARVAPARAACLRAGLHRRRGHREALDRGARAVARGRVERSVPARRETLDDARGMVVGEPVRGARGQRQRAGEAAHQREIEGIGRDAPAGDRWSESHSIVGAPEDGGRGPARVARRARAWPARA